jgi:hypothetical protein
MKAHVNLSMALMNVFAQIIFSDRDVKNMNFVMPPECVSTVLDVSLQTKTITI